LRAVVKKHGPVALVHSDSHFDTVPEYFGEKYNHGTVFARAVEEELIKIADELEEEYDARINAALVREAAEVYESRKMLKSY